MICDMIKNVAERAREGGVVDSDSLRQEAGPWGSFLLCVVFARAAGDDRNRMLRSFVYLFASVNEMSESPAGEFHGRQAALGGVSNT